MYFLVPQRKPKQNMNPRLQSTNTQSSTGNPTAIHIDFSCEISTFSWTKLVFPKERGEKTRLSGREGSALHDYR